MPELSIATALPDAEALYVELLSQMRAALDNETLNSAGMVGIHSGGVWLAERLHRDLGLSGRIGTLDISFIAMTINASDYRHRSGQLIFPSRLTGDRFCWSMTFSTPDEPCGVP